MGRRTEASPLFLDHKISSQLDLQLKQMCIPKQVILAGATMYLSMHWSFLCTCPVAAILIQAHVAPAEHNSYRTEGANPCVDSHILPHPVKLSHTSSTGSGPSMTPYLGFQGICPHGNESIFLVWLKGATGLAWWAKSVHKTWDSVKSFYR